MFNPLKRLMRPFYQQISYYGEQGGGGSRSGGGQLPDDVSAGAIGGGGNQGMNHGSSDWEPDSSYLTTLTPNEIAEGFGLDADEFGTYFDSFEGWKGGFADDQYSLDVENLGAKSAYDQAELQSQKDVLGIEQRDAGSKLSDSLSENIIASSNAYADNMASVIDSQATGLMGGASTRAARTMGQRTREATDSSSASMTKDYGATTDRINLAMNDADRKSTFLTGQLNRDIEGAAQDRDYDKTQEVMQFKDSIYDTLDALGSAGSFDTEGYSNTDWVNKITADGGFDAKDFDNDKYTPEFLKWFSENQASVDRDYMSNGETEVGLAYNDWKAGDAAGTSSGKGTWCCTAAMDTGYMTRYKTAKLKRWHLSKSDIWREGYDVWGYVIAETFIRNYKWAGRCTEAFYQWKVNNKKSKQGLIAILFIAPLSYLIGTLKVIYKGIKNG
tara:strand:- start:6247 stop:7575 length:1329 start_codon:yes stop_codon:yes gene_type:complete